MRLRDMAAVCVGFAGCTSIAGLEELEFSPSSGAGGSVGGSGATAGVGAAGGAGGEGTQGVAMAVAGSVFAASGHSQQTHLTFEQESQTWRLFYFHSADANSVRTSVSPADFQTWTEDASIPIQNAHANDGRELSVATKEIGGVRVTHVVTSHRLGATDRRVSHARAVRVADGSWVTNTPTDVSTSVWDYDALEPDSPAIVIAADDRVFLSSNRDADTEGCGNPYMWRSAEADVGDPATATSWQDSEQLSYVSFAVNSHALVPLAGAEVLAVYDNGANEPEATNLDASLFGGGMWATPGSVFSVSAPSAQNDWGIAQVAVDDVHVVRRLSTGDLQHARFDAQGWAPGGIIPPLSVLGGTGLALSTDGDRVLLAAIAAEEGNAVHATVWNGTEWGPWTARITLPAQRRFVASHAESVNGAAAVFWTEQTNEGAAITGALLAFD